MSAGRHIFANVWFLVVGLLCSISCVAISCLTLKYLKCKKTTAVPTYLSAAVVVLSSLTPLPMLINGFLLVSADVETTGFNALHANLQAVSNFFYIAAQYVLLVTFVLRLHLYPSSVSSSPTNCCGCRRRHACGCIRVLMVLCGVCLVLMVVMAVVIVVAQDLFLYLGVLWTLLYISISVSVMFLFSQRVDETLLVFYLERNRDDFYASRTATTATELSSSAEQPRRQISPTRTHAQTPTPTPTQPSSAPRAVQGRPESTTTGPQLPAANYGSNSRTPADATPASANANVLVTTTVDAHGNEHIVEQSLHLIDMEMIFVSVKYSLLVSVSLASTFLLICVATVVSTLREYRVGASFLMIDALTNCVCVFLLICPSDKIYFYRFLCLPLHGCCAKCRRYQIAYCSKQLSDDDKADFLL